MKNLRILLALIFLSTYVIASATHVMGSDIFYKHLGGSEYEITLKFYRDCRGVGFSNPSSATKIKCAFGGTAAVNLKLKSITDISPACAANANPCGSPNTSLGNQGVEEHIYVDTIDFSQAPYAALASCGSTLIIETGQCCRNSAISTGPASNNFYTFASMEFDLTSSQNSTPVFSVPPVIYTALKQPLFYNIGAIDSVDHDSLSFEFGAPLRGWNDSISYHSGLSFSMPFEVYYPGSLQYPYYNPNANPPIGIYLNPETGQLVATPVAQQVTVVVINVLEWRKNSNGVQEVISVTRRDIELIIIQSPNNNPPAILYKRSVTIGGQNCKLFEVHDPIYVPPPPLPAPAPDTLTVILRNAGPNLSMSIDSTVYTSGGTTIYGKVCYDSAWLAQGNDAIHLYAADDQCPLSLETNKTFLVPNQQATTSVPPSAIPERISAVYPNPAKDWLSISFESTVEDLEVEVIDIHGRIIQEYSESKLNELQMDCSAWTPGSYFLRIRTEAGVVIEKVLIQ